jgi:hypothetical protein
VSKIPSELRRFITRKYENITGSPLPRKMSELLTRLRRAESIRNRRRKPPRKRRPLA